MNKVSVLLPTYNRPEWLRIALDSILSCSLVGEVLICDHGSTQATARVLDDYDDPRIRRWRIEVNRSLPVSVYELLGTHVTMPYCCFFADDDVMLPGNLMHKVAILNQDPDCMAVVSDAWLINEAGNRCMTSSFNATGDVISFDDLFCSNRIAMTSVVFRSELIPLYSGIASYSGVLSDWAFWLEIAHKGKICRIPKPLIELRMHGNSDSMVEGVKGFDFLNRYPQIWKHWLDRGHKPRPEGWDAMLKAGCALVMNALNYMRETHP